MSVKATLDPDLQARWHGAIDHDAARAVIREAAYALLLEQGPQNVSMRQIAAKIGISTMTAYGYYREKEELLLDLKSSIDAHFAAALQAGGAGVTDPRLRLRATGAAYMRFAKENERPYRLMFDAILSDKPPSERPAKKSMASWNLLIGLLMALAPRMAEAEMVELARFIWATLHGLAMLHLSGRLTLDEPVEIAAAPYLDLLLDAVTSRVAAHG